jgi:hypothetical protein
MQLTASRIHWVITESCKEDSESLQLGALRQLCVDMPESAKQSASELSHEPGEVIGAQNEVATNISSPCFSTHEPLKILSMARFQQSRSENF